jgi:hypothetical protein
MGLVCQSERVDIPPWRALLARAITHRRNGYRRRFQTSRHGCRVCDGMRRANKMAYRKVPANNSAEPRIIATPILLDEMDSNAGWTEFPILHSFFRPRHAAPGGRDRSVPWAELAVVSRVRVIAIRGEITGAFSSSPLQTSIRTTMLTF